MMKTSRVLVMALATCATFLGGGILLADDAMSADGVPAALAALNAPSGDMLTDAETAAIRGQALTGLDAILERAADIEARSTVTQLPGGIAQFGNWFFGEGFLLNMNKGRGGIYNPRNVQAGTVFLTNVSGNFTVWRDSNFIVHFEGVN